LFLRPSMDFCEFCENMLYVRDVTEENDPTFTVELYCKNCKFTKPISEDNKAMLLMENHYNTERSFEQFANADIEFDPTLPHVDNIKCPNPVCDAKKNDVIYMKYDPHNILYVYFCVNCKHFWKKEQFDQEKN